MFGRQVNTGEELFMDAEAGGGGLGEAPTLEQGGRPSPQLFARGNRRHWRRLGVVANSNRVLSP